MLCHCQKEFEPKSAKQKFCCLSCANRWINQQRSLVKQARYEEQPKRCRRQDCTNTIPYEKRHLIDFCGSSCAAIENNKLFPKRRPTGEIRPCTYCGSIYQVGKNATGRFCQHKCACGYKIRRTRERVLNGEVATNPTLKRFLINEYGEQCAECGKGPIWNNKYLCLQVDHIDGNPDNNFPVNIRLLCPDCHSQTATYSNGKPDSLRNLCRIRYRQKLKEGELVVGAGLEPATSRLSSERC